MVSEPLLELSRHEPLPQSDLAAWLRLEKSTVSQLMGQLEQREWLNRERSTADKRVLLLTLTDEAQRIANELAEARNARFERLLAAISEAQRDEVQRALAVFVDAINVSV